MKVYYSPIFLALVSCANAPPAPSAAPQAASHHEHGELSSSLSSFHDVLAPLWHTTDPSARQEQTCAQAKRLVASADLTGDKELTEATKSLQLQCERPGRPEFEPTFKVVHERFHALAEHRRH